MDAGVGVGFGVALLAKFLHQLAEIFGARAVGDQHGIVLDHGDKIFDAERRNEAIQEYRTTTSTIEDMDTGSTGF